MNQEAARLDAHEGSITLQQIFSFVSPDYISSLETLIQDAITLEKAGEAQANAFAEAHRKACTEATDLIRALRTAILGLVHNTPAEDTLDLELIRLALRYAKLCAIDSITEFEVAVQDRSPTAIPMAQKIVSILTHLTSSLTRVPFPQFALPYSIRSLRKSSTKYWTD